MEINILTKNYQNKVGIVNKILIFIYKQKQYLDIPKKYNSKKNLIEKQLKINPFTNELKN